MLFSARCALASSGQRGRAATSSGSVRPSLSRSNSGPGDHRAVVGAKPWRGRDHRQSRLGAEALERLPQGHVGGHPTGDYDRGGGPAETFAEELEAHSHAVLDDVDHRRLKGRANVSDVARPQRSRRFGRVPHRRLEAGKGKVGVRPAEHGPRQREAFRIAALGRRFDRRTAGISKAEQFSGLVEGLADGVVHRRAQPIVIAHPLDRENSEYGRPTPAGSERERPRRRSGAPSGHAPRDG